MAEREKEPTTNPPLAGVGEGGESSWHHDDEIEDRLVGRKLHGKKRLRLISQVN